MSRTLLGIGEFSLLEEIIHIHLLPVLLGKCAFSDAKIQLISLLPHLQWVDFVSLTPVYTQPFSLMPHRE